VLGSGKEVFAPETPPARDPFPHRGLDRDTGKFSYLTGSEKPVKRKLVITCYILYFKETLLLNPHDSIPLYKQLSDLLRREIAEGKIGADQALPSERTLCQLYRISRITVRQALAELLTEGLLYKRQGKGTFIAKKKVNQGLVRFVNFAKTVLELNMKPSTRILENHISPADVELAKVLDVPMTSELLKLSLLGYGDQEPLVLYESYFPLALGKRMAKEATKLEKKGVPFSTYDLYERAGPLVPKYVNQTFEAITADERLARLMQVKKGVAIFMITSIFHTSDKRPLEFRKAMYRGDRYKFHLTREFT
jgi:GntR family transcriptional regulator